MTYSLSLSEKTNDDEHHDLIEQALAAFPDRIHSLYRHDGSIVDDTDEHEFAKRRFNAWAGKRALFAKRRFNSWAGRR